MGKSSNRRQLPNGPPSPCKGVEDHCRAYEAWVEAYLAVQHDLKMISDSDGMFWLPSALTDDLRINIIEHSTRLALYPRTGHRLKQIRMCFDTAWDALASDWFKVGSDLYEAIHKNRINPSDVRSSEDQSARLSAR
jgi:hypothetical protein